MRAHLAKLTPKGFLLLALPMLAVAYPVATVVLPAIFRAVVPEVVRTILQLL